MKELLFSTQYKKDAKRYRNQPKKMKKVADILRKLRDEEPIPKIHRSRMLCGECHVEGDFLLVWIDETAKQIGYYVLDRILKYSVKIKAL